MAKQTVPQIDGPMSPYGLAGFLTEAGHAVAPQRIYQYAKNGRLAIELNELGNKVVTVENGNAFIAWFLDPERGRKVTDEASDEEVAAEVS